MRVINFLPNDYLERRGLRRANLLCLAIGGGTLLALGLVTGFVFLRTAGAVAMRAVVEGQYQEATRQIGQLKQLEDRKITLLHKVDLSTDLLERVPRSYLLARLTNYLPAHTSLTSLSMQVTEVEAKPEESTGEAEAKSKGPGVPAARKAAPGAVKPASSKIKRVQFRVDGLAPTDVEVAEFLSRLSADPLFEAVDLQFSEAFSTQEGAAMRRFQLSLRLSAKAEKTMETMPTAPVSPALAGAGTKGKL